MKRKIAHLSKEISMIVDGNQLQVLYAGYFEILGVVKNSARAVAQQQSALMMLSRKHIA
jgi:hypothetical protein